MAWACCLVIEDALAITPARGGKEQCRDEPFFAIRGGVGGQFFSIRGTMPGEITLVGTVRLVHVGFRPLPDAVELGFFIELDRDHHAVGHAFGAHIAVADIFDISHILADRVINALGIVIAIKELLPGGFQLALHLGIGFAKVFLKEIAIGNGRPGVLSTR